MQAAGAQRATVAAGITQDAPDIAKLVAVLPCGLQDVAVGVRVLLINTVRNEADPLLGVRRQKDVAVN